MNGIRDIPDYFVQQIRAKFNLDSYATAPSDLEVRYPSTPMLVSPNFLEAYKYLAKASSELDQSATQIFFLTKLTNLSRKTFKVFLQHSKKCKEIFLLPKITFDNFESPAPFPLILMHLTRSNPPHAFCTISVWWWWQTVDTLCSLTPCAVAHHA